ncbi:MAG: TolC family protein [Pirellulales bacterium]|nr:TolC family protein [Pirellulales bacterium]
MSASAAASGIVVTDESTLSMNHSWPENRVNTIPAEFKPWWDESVRTQLRGQSTALYLSLSDVVGRAMSHSARIDIISSIPKIKHQALQQQKAAFDWTNFLESKYDDLSEPVGSTLTTGGPSRSRSNDWTLSSGVRRRNRLGGEFSVSQGIGHATNNSLFFVPPRQGTSRMTLSYTQPLRRGAGKFYNISLIMLAKNAEQVARHELAAELQAELLEIIRAYWTLHHGRAVWLQKYQLYQNGTKILKMLEHRRNLDAAQSQLIRARAAVADRNAQLDRARLAVYNTEARLRKLVNDPEFSLQNNVELIPLDEPILECMPIEIPDAVETALQFRPEIDAAIKRAKAASIHLKISKNELLPQLDLVFSTYASGLRGGGRIGDAWVDQFRVGEPSYSVGLYYELPLGNRAACARYQQRKLQLQNVRSQLQHTVNEVAVDAEVAARELITAHREMQAKYFAMNAWKENVANIEQRWRKLPSNDRSAAFVLQDLLDAQDSQVNAEFAFLQTQVVYNLAIMNLQRAMGHLMNVEEALPQHESQYEPQEEEELPAPAETISN